MLNKAYYNFKCLTITIITLTGFLSYSQDSLIPFLTSGGTYVYSNRNSNVILDQKRYAYADFFQNERGLVKEISTDLFGFLDLSGKEIIPCKYKYASSFNENRAMITTTADLIGYVNTLGIEIIKPTYKFGTTFFGGVAAVSKDEVSYFLIDSLGRMLESSPKWEKVPELHYDENGNEVQIFKYEKNINNTPIVVKGVKKRTTRNKDNRLKEELLSQDGEIINAIQYDHIDLDYFESNPFIKVYLNDSSSYGLIDKSGKIILPIGSFKNTNISAFRNGFAITQNAIIMGDGNIKAKFYNEEIVNRNDQFLILYNGDYGTYRIYDLLNNQFQKSKYSKVSKIVKNKFLANDTLSRGLFLVDAFTEKKEDSLIDTEFNDIRTRWNYDERHPLPVFVIDLYDKINFVLVKDTVIKYSFKTLGYDLKYKGLLHRVDLEYTSVINYTENNEEKVEEMVSVLYEPPILLDVIITEYDTLLKFSCSKLSFNEKGLCLLSDDGAYRNSIYEVLVDLSGNVRFEIEFGNNFIDTVITRDKEGLMLNKYSLNHPSNGTDFIGHINFLKKENLFVLELQSALTNKSGHSYDPNFGKINLYMSSNLKTLYCE